MQAASQKASDTNSRSAANGLAVPFMELLVGKSQRDSQEVWGQAKGLAGKLECNNERSEGKQREGAERLEDKQRARKRALQKAVAQLGTAQWS